MKRQTNCAIEKEEDIPFLKKQKQKKMIKLQPLKHTELNKKN